MLWAGSLPFLIALVSSRRVADQRGTPGAAGQPSSHQSPALDTPQRWAAAGRKEQSRWDGVNVQRLAPVRQGQPQQHKVDRSSVLLPNPLHEAHVCAL